MACLPSSSECSLKFIQNLLSIGRMHEGCVRPSPKQIDVVLLVSLPCRTLVPLELKHCIMRAKEHYEVRNTLHVVRVILQHDAVRKQFLDPIEKLPLEVRFKVHMLLL